MRILLGVLAAGLVVVSAGLAKASTTYTDRAAFEAAAGALNNANFEGRVTPPFDGVYYGATMGYNGVFFDGQEISITSKDFAPSVFIAATQYGSDYAEWEGDTLLATFPFILDGPVSAFGFEFMESQGHAASFTIDVDGASTSIVTGATKSFFGFIGSAPIDTVTISTAALGRDAGNYWTLDNFLWHSAEVTVGGGVPEPTTWTLMLLGFGGLGATLRRRNAAARAVVA